MAYTARQLIKIVKLQNIKQDWFGFDMMSKIKIAVSLNGLYLRGKKFNCKTSLDVVFSSCRV